MSYWLPRKQIAVETLSSFCWFHRWLDCVCSSFLPWGTVSLSTPQLSGMLARCGPLIWRWLLGIQYCDSCRIILLPESALFSVRLVRPPYFLERRVGRWEEHTFKSKLIVGYFSDPKGGNVSEAFFLGDIVDNHDSMSPFVVSPSDGPKPLLASCIPDLQFDNIAVDGDGSTRWLCSYLNLKSTPMVAR